MCTCTLYDVEASYQGGSSWKNVFRSKSEKYVKFNRPKGFLKLRLFFKLIRIFKTLKYHISEKNHWNEKTFRPVKFHIFLYFLIKIYFFMNFHLNVLHKDNFEVIFVIVIWNVFKIIFLLYLSFCIYWIYILINKIHFDNHMLPNLPKWMLPNLTFMNL